MGWSGGSEHLSGVVRVFRAHGITGTPTQIAGFFSDLVTLCEEADCDTLDECLGTDSVLDGVLRDHGYLHKEG